MANDERPVEDVLRTGLRALALRKGACPPVERILAYQAHEHSQEAEGEIRAHLLVCGRCEALLLNIERFAEPVTVPKVPWRSTLRFFGRPWLAYSLAALLLAALVMHVGREQTVVRVASPAVVAEALPAFDLPQTREPGDFVVRPGRSGRFILRFFVPMSADRRYVVDIRDATNQEVLSPVELGSGDGRGNVDLVCRTNAFTAGSYTLTVMEDGSARQFQYSFQVR